MASRFDERMDFKFGFWHNQAASVQRLNFKPLRVSISNVKFGSGLIEETIHSFSLVIYMNRRLIWHVAGH